MARLTEFHRQQKAWVSDERKGEERREAGRSTSPTTSFERPVCPAAVLQATVRARWRGTDHERSKRGCARLELGFYRAKEGGKASACSKGTNGHDHYRNQGKCLD
jgi:hypothetical protein